MDNREELNESKQEKGIPSGDLWIHNSEMCKVEKNRSDINIISANKGEIDFTFEHIDIPSSSVVYYLVFPVKHRLTGFHLLKAYDPRREKTRRVSDFDTAEDVTRLPDTRCNILWDTECQIQFVSRLFQMEEMSFILSGNTRHIDETDTRSYTPSQDVEDGLTRIGENLLRYDFITESDQRFMHNSLAQKILSDYLIVKPNISGLGAEVDNILIDYLQEE